jgi:hypothetical protein
MLVLKSEMSCFKLGVLGCNATGWDISGIDRWILVGTSMRSAWILEFYSSNHMDNYVSST